MIAQALVLFLTCDLCYQFWYLAVTLTKSAPSTVCLFDLIDLSTLKLAAFRTSSHNNI